MVSTVKSLMVKTIILFWHKVHRKRDNLELWHTALFVLLKLNSFMVTCYFWKMKKKLYKVWRTIQVNYRVALLMIDYVNWRNCHKPTFTHICTHMAVCYIINCNSYNNYFLWSSEAMNLSNSNEEDLSEKELIDFLREGKLEVENPKWVEIMLDEPEVVV